MFNQPQRVFLIAYCRIDLSSVAIQFSRNGFWCLTNIGFWFIPFSVVSVLASKHNNIGWLLFQLNGPIFRSWYISLFAPNVKCTNSQFAPNVKYTNSHDDSRSNSKFPIAWKFSSGPASTLIQRISSKYCNHQIKLFRLFLYRLQA